MAAIIKPGAFNEQFTIYLNTVGKPVRRTLREMTADEVLLAMNWSLAEADRLSIEAEPARQLAIAIEEGRAEEIGSTHEQIKDSAAILRRAGEAMESDARLLSLVASAMPQWRGSGLTLVQALRRYWPRGRAA